MNWQNINVKPTDNAQIFIKFGLCAVIMKVDANTLELMRLLGDLEVPAQWCYFNTQIKRVTVITHE